MIRVTDKRKCCGCSACASVCPKQCIRLRDDADGFAYPAVDLKRCVDCGRCEQVCPMLHDGEMRKPLVAWAAYARDEAVRVASSSGGIFTLLARQVLNEGGIVFGCRFDARWLVMHDAAETLGQLAAFQGSKYAQSAIGTTYRQAEKWLKQGRKVLFSGTPCQIKGLKLFLRKDYPNLLAVDVICHGVPSPLAWRKYVGEMGGEAIRSVSFRDKKQGWKNYQVRITCSKNQSDGETQTTVSSSCFQQNPYMRAFLSDLTLRPACYACAAKGGRSGSDVTLGDFWGIDRVKPLLDDDKGCSAVLAYSERALLYLQASDMVCEKVAYADVLQGNRSLEQSVPEPINRNFFFQKLRCGTFAEALKITESRRLTDRVRRWMFRKRRCKNDRC